MSWNNKEEIENNMQHGTTMKQHAARYNNEDYQLSLHVIYLKNMKTCSHSVQYTVKFC